MSSLFLRRRHIAGAITVLAFGGLLFSSARVLAAPAATVIATGLDEPKQPTVGPDGWVYVALSGHASPADPPLDGRPFNKSGAIVRISPAGVTEPVVSGLLSRFDEGTAVGPSGLAFWNGSLYLSQAIDDPLNGAADTMVSSPVLKVKGNSTRVFTQFNAVGNDPSTASDPDTNPFACAAGPDGKLYVSDGGENGVWRVEANGDSSLLVQFPGDPTITGIAPVWGRRGHDFPNRKHGFEGLVVCLFGNGRSGFANGRVEMVDEGASHTLVPTGVITMPISPAYSPSGHLYVLQFATPNTHPGPPFAPMTGAIWSISRTGAATKVLGGLNFPTGLCFAQDGTAYVTNNGILPAAGHVSGELVKVTGL
jgi:hypothetical protein